jgi:outer membrane protein assembly factor BamB
VAAGCALPEALDPERNLLWRRELAAGYSSPVVAGDYLFLTAAEGESLLTICLSAETGEEEWIAKTPYDGTQRIGQNSPAAPTPVTDGESVFVLFHHVGLLAYDMDGRELWSNDLDAPFMIPHGLSSSPVLHDGRVVVQIDQDGGSRLVCVDAESGETLWDVPRSVNHGYSTPAILDPEEGPTQVIASGGLRITSYDLATGKELWWVQGAAWQVKCVPVIHDGTVLVNAFMASSGEMCAPAMNQSFDEVVAERDADGDGTISLDEWDIDFLKMAFPIFDLNKDKELDAADYDYLVTAGSEVGGLFAIRPDGRGDVTESHVSWLYDQRRGLSDVLAPVVVGDTLFQLRDGGVLTAMDVVTGEVVKQERVGSPDAYFASPVAAGDRLLLASRGGLLTVVSAGRDFEELSSHDLEEQVWSVPALTGERVFVRSQEALYCFDTKLAAEPAADEDDG